MRGLAELLSVAGLFIAGCATARVPQEASAPPSVYRYPAWFVSGELVGNAAVGYAPRYQTRQLSESLSVVDGAERLRAYRRLRLSDEQAFVAQAGGSLQSVAEIVRIVPLLPEVEGKLLAFAERGTMALSLVAEGARAPVDGRDIALSARAPSWISAPPRASSGSVAVGIARATYREELGWQAAEENGLRQLAAIALSEVRGLQRTTAEAQESVVSSKAEAVLESVVVLARWRDAENCYVLMRAVTMPFGTKP